MLLVVPDAATVCECADAIREALDGRREVLIFDDMPSRTLPRGSGASRIACRLLVTTRNPVRLTPQPKMFTAKKRKECKARSVFS